MRRQKEMTEVNKGRAPDESIIEKAGQQAAKNYRAGWT